MGEEKFKQETSRRKARIFKRVILIALILLVVGVPAFLAFRLKSEGRFALREAKNVKIAFEMISVEYYGMGLSIYDSESASGLTDGVKTRLEEVVDDDFDVTVTAYNQTTRAVTAFEYTDKNYTVRYVYDDQKGDTWKVYYKYLIYDFDGE
jgi:hypothetical protein